MGFEYEGLEDAIVSAVEECCTGCDVALASSGGLDSGLLTVLASGCAESVTMYTCGTAGCADAVAASDLSERTGIPLVHLPISRDTVEDDIRGLMSATGTSDPFTVSYELQLYCVCRAAREDVVLTGQGADEYFMGCAKYVGCSKEDYDILVRAGKERLKDVSIPCEKAIARHFGKDLRYPYMAGEVVGIIESLDPSVLRPMTLDGRKQVLKDIAVHLGYGFLAERKKKSSQYGSGTTDLIRSLARGRGMMYNQYISVLYDEAVARDPNKGRGEVIYARVDPVVKAKAESILRGRGITPSEAIELFYRDIIDEAERPSRRLRDRFRA